MHYNLKIETLINASKFSHNNLIFDTINNLSGFSTLGSGLTLSEGKLYNSSTNTASAITTVNENPTNIKRVSVVTKEDYAMNTSKIVKGIEFESSNYSKNGDSIELKITGSQEVYSNSNLIPTMTSNYSNGINISASNNYKEDYPYKAFDGITKQASPRSIWYTTTSSGKGENGHWIRVDFNSNRKRVLKVSLNAFSVSGSKGSIKNFRISASNNDTSYTLLYSGLHPNTYGSFNDFSFSNPYSYRFYKIEIKDSYYGANNVGITECRMFGYATTSIYADETESSKVIDLGENVKEIKNFNIDYIASGGSISLEVATSDDGVVFSDFKKVPLSGSYSSKGIRYLKLKVKLTPERTTINGGSYNSRTPKLNNIQVNFTKEVSTDPIKIFVSNDNGNTWYQTDEKEFLFSASALGKQMKIKFDLKPGQELKAYSATWA